MYIPILRSFIVGILYSYIQTYKTVFPTTNQFLRTAGPHERTLHVVPSSHFTAIIGRFFLHLHQSPPPLGPSPIYPVTYWAQQVMDKPRATWLSERSKSRCSDASLPEMKQQLWLPSLNISATVSSGWSAEPNGLSESQTHTHVFPSPQHRCLTIFHKCPSVTCSSWRNHSGSTQTWTELTCSFTQRL